MRNLSILTMTAALLMIASTAWACGPAGGEMLVIGLILAPLLTLPYALFGSGAIAWQAREWYPKGRRFGGWFIASIGAWLTATLGGAAGIGLAALTDNLGSSNLDGALVLSTPLVFEVAYLMWLNVRAQRRNQGAA